VSRDAQLQYEPLERLRVPRPVDRLAYVADACRSRRVLDLGALDETAFAQKRGRGTWLHERIAEQAQYVLGVDSSPAVPREGLATAANARIVRGEVDGIDGLLEETGFRPEVVVAGELIEHVPSPLAFLQQLKASPRLAGCALILTTPNATAAHNVAIGLLSRESTHRDHLCILSYKTLHTLCARAALGAFELVPYRSAFVEMRARNPGLGGALVGASEKAVNAVEWLFPLLSFGWIVRAAL